MRPRKWALVWGALAAACGSSSDLAGLDTSPSGVGGVVSAGGSPVGARPAVGGTGTAVGGAHPSGGSIAYACELGNPCSTPDSYCINGNLTCHCVNGAWGICAFNGVTGGTGPTGGSSTGGFATGGIYHAATGGAPPTSLCDSVATLPTTGTACATVGESQCTPSGGRCLCARGIWYCNNACPGSQPTPDAACTRGAACTYNNGNTGCACINLRWMCVGVTSCPASVPTTGNACNGLTGVACDYPNANPAFHFACACAVNGDADAGVSWICIQSAACPATPPAYDLSQSCAGTAICAYGNVRCACLQAGTPWVCL